MSSTHLKAQRRDQTEKGRGAARRMRKAGQLPAVIYGLGEALALKLDHDSFLHFVEDESVFTSVLSIDIDGHQEQVVIKDMQRHLFANKIDHVDFQRVNDELVIEKRIPFVTVGASRSPGVRLGAMLTPLMANVLVRCKTKDLPKCIEIDCSTLEASSSIKMSELSIPEGIQLVPLLKGGREYDHAVVMVGKPR